jgi:hypothetical protein
MIKNGSITLGLMLFTLSPARTQPAADEIAKLRTRIEVLETALVELKRQLLDVQGELKKVPKPDVPVKIDDSAIVTNTMRDFFEDIDKGRILSAYRSTSQRYQKNTDRGGFGKFVSDYNAPLVAAANTDRNPLPEFKSRRLGKDSAFECDVVIVESGRRINLTVRLVKEDGEWKIDEFVEIVNPPKKK